MLAMLPLPELLSIYTPSFPNSFGNDQLEELHRVLPTKALSLACWARAARGDLRCKQRERSALRLMPHTWQTGCPRLECSQKAHRVSHLLPYSSGYFLGFSSKAPEEGVLGISWIFYPFRVRFDPSELSKLAMKPLADRPTFIDLFAGCGGLSLGLEQAGFYPLYVNELNNDALETYLVNRDKHYPHLRDRYHSNDIKELIQKEGFFDDLLRDLGKEFDRNFRSKSGSVDLVAGGPPCQGYSGIGIRRSYSVDKVQLPSNHLYQDMAHFVHRINPKMFLFENVEGLLNARWTTGGEKGEIFRDVLKTFRSIPGYAIGYRLIHAKDYGVPQNRPRVLLVGIREDIHLPKGERDGEDALKRGFLPKPRFGAPDIQDVFSDLIDYKFEYGGSTAKYPRDPKNKWQERIRRKPSGRGYAKKNEPVTEHDYSKHSHGVIERFSYMIENHGKIPSHLKTKKFAQRLLPAKWGDKGPTITACSLPDDFVHYKQARSLTVREWARLQTFPDWYQFAGKRTTGGLRRAGNPRKSVFDREVPKYTQIGNAVPVQLAEKVGRHFKKILKSADK